MPNKFTAVIERDGEWFVAYCSEMPEANGQGPAPGQAKTSLSKATASVLANRREDGLRGG